MHKNLSKILLCYRRQCYNSTAKPCWIRRDNNLQNGINLHGYFLSEIGLGESVRLLYKSLSTQNLQVAACNLPLEGRQNEKSFANFLSEDAPYKFGLTVDGLTGFKGMRRNICAQKFNIAVPFWELDNIPAKYIDYLKKFDTIWAPSTFISEILNKYGFNDLELIKHPVQLPLVPQYLNISGTLKILFYFDFDSYPARKNPEAAVYAFKQAFPNREDVALTIKTRGGRDQGRRHWLAQQTSGDPRIAVVDRLLSPTEMDELMESHHVFLSLHRSEGLGLGCAEALAAGKAVIATDYGGSTDFINVRTGFPVEWSPVKVGSEDYVLSENSSWADPSVDHAAKLLRSIYENPMDARERVKYGFKHLVDNHSYETVGNRLLEKLSRRGLQ